jgi:LacI family transcriptional regulator
VLSEFLPDRPATTAVALETLIAYLTSQDKPIKVHRFAPHIILRSNFPLFVNRLANVAGISAS